MIIQRSIPFKNIIKWSGVHFLVLAIFSGSIAGLYYFEIISIRIPWLPISVIGTAVAFYVGFKNNASYDRMWEARKIWGGIVNDSRSWGMFVDAYISNLFSKNIKSDSEILKIKQRLIYRHIAWLYTHRNQLLQPTPWEHISQGGITKRMAANYQKKYGIGLVEDEVTKIELDKFLSEEEHQKVLKYSNSATQIINGQSRDLAKIREENLIDDFRHIEMENLLSSFYTSQGKNERIKKFPLPRQYATMSRIFVWIFIFLLPFSMIPELMNIGKVGLWLSIPITALVGWVYIMMEEIGDFSENPFQGMANDIPMLSLCRTIEIDLREMLGEEDLPLPIEAKDGILM